MHSISNRLMVHHFSKKLLYLGKNYRPVSNLNYVAKLMEKVVANQIKVHVGAELAQLVRWMTLNQEVPGSSLDTAI